MDSLSEWTLWEIEYQREGLVERPVTEAPGARVEHRHEAGGLEVAAPEGSRLAGPREVPRHRGGGVGHIRLEVQTWVLEAVLQRDRPAAAHPPAAGGHEEEVEEESP